MYLEEMEAIEEARLEERQLTPVVLRCWWMELVGALDARLRGVIDDPLLGREADFKSSNITGVEGSQGLVTVKSGMVFRLVGPPVKTEGLTGNLVRNHQIQSQEEPAE